MSSFTWSNYNRSFPCFSNSSVSLHIPPSLNIIQSPQWFQWCRADHICSLSNINQLSLSIPRTNFLLWCKISSRFEALFLSCPSSSHIILMTLFSLVSISAYIIYSAWHILTSPRFVWLIPSHHWSLSSPFLFFWATFSEHYKEALSIYIPLL